jgi:cation:H+ antiporter
MFLLGVLGLYYGANFLIKGSVQIANYFKISKMVIALTLVAAGTSMPEFFVTLLGAMKGKPDISVGNVVGSNIANISLVLGLACLVLPFKVKKRTLTTDYPIVALTTIIFYYFMFDQLLGWWEGLILFTLFFFYLWIHLTIARKERKLPEEPLEREMLEMEVPQIPVKLMKSFLWVILGIVLLYIASEGLIRSAVFFARIVGLSERVIGATLIAVGTSIPEIFTSLIASFKKEEDISLGNVLGSNFLNVAMVIGLVAFISPLPVAEQVISREGLVMIGVTLAILPLALFRKFNRFSGVFLLLLYSGFLYVVFQ